MKKIKAIDKTWNDKEYKLCSSMLLTDLVITKYIDLFWKEVMSTVKNDQHVLLLFKVKFEYNQIITLNDMKIINNSSKDNLSFYMKDRLALSLNSYKINPIVSIIFKYGIRDGEVTPTLGSVQPKGINYQVYYKNELPIALLPEEYGLILKKRDNYYTISVNRGKSKAIVLLTVKKINSKTINKVDYIKNNNLLFSWTDTITSFEDKSFIREIGKSVIHFKSGDFVLYTTKKKTRPIIKKAIIEKKLTTNFITMDIETLNINNTLVPYLLCWFDGIKKKSYFILPQDELNKLHTFSKIEIDNYMLDLISDVMKDICIRKYKGYKIYLHNLSKFDAYFLIKYLAKLGKVNPIVHKDRIIKCKFKLYESKYSVTFLDSYLILPNSLKDLSNSFKIDSPKGIFPFLLNNINYQGLVPDFKYFNDINLDDYNKYKDSFIDKIWNFKEESVKYCELDCVSLYQILIKFNELIYNKFSLNIINSPTLPSLSFSLFRTKYLPKDSIHMLSGEIADRIRKSYTGGAVDMYLTRSSKHKQIFAYDVNSLYPYVMSKFKFPVGSPTYFKGDILKIDPNAFGFFYCKVKVNSYLKKPILQAHITTKEGIKSVFPTGNWEGMYFSEELFNATKNGYKFEVLWGYTFESGYVFKDFINDLYNLRLEYTKSDPMNYIAKILMNSLYGRFGMDDNFVNTKILTKSDYSKFEDKIKDGILDIVDLEDNYLVHYRNPLTFNKVLLDDSSETHNVNVAIASAVTAYARIHMAQFKNNINLPLLYYSDTDSLYFEGPLPDKFISKTELGKLKLEGIYDKAVFLAPKVYALKNKQEEIIKIKGLSKDAIVNNNISINTLEQLLLINSELEIKQNNFFRNLDLANINILEQIYTLKVTNNKYELAYNSYNILVAYRPFFLVDGEIINVKEFYKYISPYPL